jgi:hypothetical protein
MSAAAQCIECREALNEDGICPSCDPAGAEIAAKLRRLRDEIARERAGAPAKEPRSLLWRRKKAQLERAKEEADQAGGADPARRPEPSGSAPPREASRGAAPSRAVDPEPSAEGGPPRGEADVRSVPPESPGPTRVYGGVSASGIRARELDVTDPRHGSDAVQELLEHRRRGLGKIVGMAGLPRHGKTKLADRLRERYAERPGADLRYDKTERGEVNIYYVPGRREHHVLIDVAGEDFQALGDYDRDLPALVRQFLWPVLQELDGLVLLMALPIVWAGWNDPHLDRRLEPTEQDEIAMRDARERMVNAHRMLLKYALVAQDLTRLRKVMPQLGLDPLEAPTRNQVDDAFQTAARLKAPVAVAFSKADLYAPRGSDGRPRRSGLYTPDLPHRSGQPAPPLHPLRTDPLLLGHLHFPELFEFLMERVRYFKFDFVQALEDRSEEPSPHEAAEAQADATRDSLLGGEALLEFATQRPWPAGLDASAAIRLDRRLHPRRWDRDALRALHRREDER